MKNNHLLTRKGFSFIELFSVIIIISILAISAYPLINSTAESSLHGAIEVIKSDIRLTQIKAMTRGAPGSVVFTSGASDYRYDDDGSIWLSRNLANISSGVTIINDAIITFNSLGELAASSSASSVTVSSDGVSRTLTLEPYTGKVKE